VHLQNTLCDLFGTRHNACGWPLQDVMRQMAEVGEGVIVVLRNRDSAADLLARLKDFQLHDEDDVVPARRQDRNALRTYGIGAQILSDVGVRKMRVMSAPKAMHAISGFDLEVVEYTGGRPKSDAST
jgi:3,4-dihydroxy 2-butanone 4-phosphate synthase/GTP cyclohydrolase II